MHLMCLVQAYTPVASCGSTLFTVITELANLDPMYKWSVQWFTNLFICAIVDSETSDDLDQRLQSLNSYLLKLMFTVRSQVSNVLPNTATPSLRSVQLSSETWAR